jgi:hypothetical protein
MLQNKRLKNKNKYNVNIKKKEIGYCKKSLIS